MLRILKLFSQILADAIGGNLLQKLESIKTNLKIEFDENQMVTGNRGLISWVTSTSLILLHYIAGQYF